MFYRKLTYYSVLSIFVVVALYSTLSHVTNLTWSDFKTAYESPEMKDHDTLVLNPQIKQINNIKNVTENVSHDNEEEYESLEDSLNLDEYERVTVTATGYTAGPESTGKREDHPEYGITYSGVEVTRDLYSTIAADLDVFPLGTILYIPDYGYGVVTDIGGAIKGHKIDLYFPTVDDVYNQWGKKDVDVFVVKYGNGHITAEELQVLNEDEALQVFREAIKRPS